MSTTRLEYRDSRVPKAVCVYTIAQESRYLVIENVPNLGVSKELLERFGQFGVIKEHRILDEHKSSSELTDVHWIKYDTVKSARIAKRKMDDKLFFANLLRVSYAPEYETFDDTREKFQDRLESIHSKLSGSSSFTHARRKRKLSTSSMMKSKYKTVHIGPTIEPPPPPPTKESTNHSPPSTEKRRRI